MSEWLLRSTLEISILIGGLLLINPLVRRVSNAQIAYCLWLIPLLTLLIWNKPERPKAVMEAIGLPDGGIVLQMKSNAWIIPDHPALLWIWGAGIIIWLAIRISLYWRFRNLLQQTSTPLNKSLSDLEEIQSLPKFINIIQTKLSSSPFVFGLISPAIYLPKNFFNHYDNEEQKWIIRHELTHLKRKDLWIQLIAEILRACFWFNPIIHLAWSKFREDQELACDHHALKNCDSKDRQHYGKALLTSVTATYIPVSMMFFTSRKKERFIMLQKHTPSKIKSILGISFSLVIAAVTLTQAPTTTANNSDKNINLAVEHIQLDKVVLLLSDLSGFELTGEKLDPSKHITLVLNEVPWDQALSFVLNCSGYDYVEEGFKLKIIKKVMTSKEQKKCKEVFFEHTAAMALRDKNSKKKSELMKSYDVQGDRILKLINKGSEEDRAEFLRIKKNDYNDIARQLKHFDRIASTYGALKYSGTLRDDLGNGLSKVKYRYWSKKEEKIFILRVISELDKPDAIIDIDFNLGGGW